jgi:hypothetical protein
MLALLLRRTAFLATLATGLGLTVTGVLGLSAMDRDLELAAHGTRQAEPAFVCDRGPGCDGRRGEDRHGDWRRS